MGKNWMKKYNITNINNKNMPYECKVYMKTQAKSNYFLTFYPMKKRTKFLILFKISGYIQDLKKDSLILRWLNPRPGYIAILKCFPSAKVMEHHPYTCMWVCVCTLYSSDTSEFCNMSSCCRHHKLLCILLCILFFWFVFCKIEWYQKMTVKTFLPENRINNAWLTTCMH